MRYLHSEVDTLRRVELLRELRLGEYDVLVGINLLREGLDLPEVSLVASSTPTRRASCAPRAASSRRSAVPPATCPARCTCTPTRSPPRWREAIDETSRRREKQIAYNTERGIDPQPLRKKIADITDMLAREDADTEALLGAAGPSPAAGPAAGDQVRDRRRRSGPPTATRPRSAQASRSPAGCPPRTWPG